MVISVPTSVWRTLLATVLVLAIVTGALWFSLARDDSFPEEDTETGVAVLPSDQGVDGTETSTPTPTGRATNPANEQADTAPEQVAVAFMDTYPGDVAALADPTFLASLDGVEATLLGQAADLSVTHVDHASDEAYERYAYTATGTYQGQQMPIYTIVVARPAEPGEGGGAAENDLPFKVHSFDWAPGMLGDEDKPGPAANQVAPIGAAERTELISHVRTDVIEPILTVDSEESTEQRQARLDELTIEPIVVTPPMSRSGRYAMTTEILTQSYSTEPGGPITITYTGTWVDPYDPSFNGSWSWTATIACSADGHFNVQSVEKTAPAAANGHDE